MWLHDVTCPNMVTTDSTSNLITCLLIAANLMVFLMLQHQQLYGSQQLNWSFCQTSFPSFRDRAQGLQVHCQVVSHLEYCCLLGGDAGDVPYCCALWLCMNRQHIVQVVYKLPGVEVQLLLPEGILFYYEHLVYPYLYGRLYLCPIQTKNELKSVAHNFKTILTPPILKHFQPIIMAEVQNLYQGQHKISYAIMRPVPNVLGLVKQNTIYTRHVNEHYPLSNSPPT